MSANMDFINTQGAPKAEKARETLLPLRARICLTASVLVLVAGLLSGFGAVDWYASLWTTHPVWSCVLTVGIVAGVGLIFDRTRSIAGWILVGGVLLLILVHMAAFSGYGWYVFFTEGTDLQGKYPLAISTAGAALIVLGIVMVSFCCCMHMGADDQTFACRAAQGVAYSVMFTAFALLMVTVLSRPAPKHIAALPEALKCLTESGSTTSTCGLPTKLEEDSKTASTREAK